MYVIVGFSLFSVQAVKRIANHLGILPCYAARVLHVDKGSMLVATKFVIHHYVCTRSLLHGPSACLQRL